MAGTKITEMKCEECKMETEVCSKIVNAEMKKSMYKTMELLEKKRIKATLKGFYDGNLVLLVTTPRRKDD